MEAGRDQKESAAPFKMHFSDSAPHAIRVDYAHSAPMFGAGVHLRWQPDARVMRDQAVRLRSRQTWS